MFSFKSILVATFLSLATFSSAAASPASPGSTSTASKPIVPVVEYEFSMFVNLKPCLLAEGPFGERVNCGYNNGTITGKTGNQIGTIAPGAGVTVGDSSLCQGYLVMEGNSTSFPSMNKETYVYTLRRSISLNTIHLDVFKASYPGVPS
ncbi:hypothetical protein BDQ17DRAFT_1489976 [Cyathus striatus]|nr:hypothetical protein BDQ17DRAFT_1489976 [Cyathus striatus]